MVSRETGDSWQSREVTVQIVPETGSTQDDLIAALRDNAGRWPHLSGVRALRQNAGRGRVGRQWHTEGLDALTISYVLRPGAPVEQWGTIALRAGVAVVQALQECGAQVLLKWPNDVVVPAGPQGSRWAAIEKVGGILGSVVQDSSGRYACVLGVGLNLRGEVSAAGGTSLGLGGTVEEVEVAVRNQLARAIPEAAENFKDLDPLMEKYCHTLGRQVEVTFSSEESARKVRGCAHHIDETGALVVQTSGGAERILNGDVAHTRLAQ